MIDNFTFQKPYDMKPINVFQKFEQFNDKWNPKIIGELNGQHVKIAKIEGEFPFHNHENEDELFYVMKGSMVMEYEDHKQVVNQGEMIIVPKGVMHRPVTQEEVWIMLFEPAQIKHTGNVQHEKTVKNYEWI